MSLETRERHLTRKGWAAAQDIGALRVDTQRFLDRMVAHSWAMTEDDAKDLAWLLQQFGWLEEQLAHVRLLLDLAAQALED